MRIVVEDVTGGLTTDRACEPLKVAFSQLCDIILLVFLHVGDGLLDKLLDPSWISCKLLDVRLRLSC